MLGTPAPAGCSRGGRAGGGARRAVASRGRSRASRSRRGRRRARRRAAAAPREPGLPALHLGLDRAAQGGGDAAPRAWSTWSTGSAPRRPGGPATATLQYSPLELRRVVPGDLLHLGGGRPAGAGGATRCGASRRELLADARRTGSGRPLRPVRRPAAARRGWRRARSRRRSPCGGCSPPASSSAAGGDEGLARRAAPASGCANHYGPTETHVITSYALGGESADGPSCRRSAGRSRGAPLRLLDRRRAAGAGRRRWASSWIGGAGLARGYLRRPELTAERFVPDPLGRRRGRGSTGPATWRATCRTASSSSSAGRDHQVKVRGFRIEPGEIEAASRAHPAVRGGVVGVVREEAGARGWWPRVARSRRRRPRRAALRCERCGRGGCREYMVPRRFVLLDALPLTPNGKVDRRALPRLGAGDAQRSRRTTSRPRDRDRGAAGRDLGRAPRGAARVGLDDDFFDLGGHSLLAAQLAVAGAAGVRRRAAARARCSRRRRSPSSARERRARGLAGDRARGAAARRRSPRRPACRSPSPSSGSGSSTSSSRAPRPTTCRCALRLAGALDRPALERGARRARSPPRGAAHRLRRGRRRARCSGSCCRRRPFALPRIDLGGPAGRRGGRGARVAGAAEARPAVRPRARAAAPRRSCSRLGARRARPARRPCTTSRRDGWSMGVLVRELAALYGAFAAGAAVAAAARCRCSTPTTRSGSAAGSTASALEAQLAYWRARLAGAAAGPRAADRPAAAARSRARAAAGVATRARPRADRRGSSAARRRRGATLFMVAARRLPRRCSAATPGSDDLVGRHAGRQPRPAARSRG